jgi:hypothetical protein
MTKIQKLIPSFDVVVNIIEVPEAGVEKIHLKPEEWKILSFVDGSRIIKDIASKARVSEFETVRILYGLISSGLVKIVQKTKTLKPVKKMEEKKNDEKEGGGLFGLFKKK